MKKQILKPIRKISHLHLHLGMYIAIAAILVTAMHTSKDMIHAIYNNTQSTQVDGDHQMMRESRAAETHIAHAQISFVRRSYVGGA